VPTHSTDYAEYFNVVTYLTVVWKRRRLSATSYLDMHIVVSLHEDGIEFL